MSIRLWPGQERAVHSACIESYLYWQTQSSKAQNLLSTQMPFTWLLHTLYTDFILHTLLYSLYRHRGYRFYMGGLVWCTGSLTRSTHRNLSLCSSVRWCGENPWERLPPGGHLGEAPPFRRRNNWIADHMALHHPRMASESRLSPLRPCPEI